MAKGIFEGSIGGLLAGLAAFATFSSHDMLIKYLGSQYSVFQILFFSGLFAFIPVTLLMSTDKQLDNFVPKHPWLITIRAVCSMIAMSCAFYAFSVLPLTEVYAVIFAMPLLITILAVPLLGETVRLRRGIAVLIGLLGVVVVLRPGINEFTLGHGATLVAALASALGAITVRKLGRDERTAVILLYPMLGSLVLMASLQPFVYQPVQLPHLALMGCVGLLAFFAQMLMVVAYRKAQAALVAPMQYSQIVWAVIFGAWIFGEKPDLWVLVGSGVIIASGLYIVLREGMADVSDTNPVLKNANVRADAGLAPRPKTLREILDRD